MSFREKLKSERFIITAEISPPKGTDTEAMLKEAERIGDVVDAINVTDNQRAVMRMSSLVACSILMNKGYETIMHLTCRDRNRLALQSELLGAYALGIKNILVMSGDYPTKGDHEGAKPVYDLDSVQLLGVINKLNQGFDIAGNKLEGRTDFCAGVVSNIELNQLALLKLEKKIRMGARFVQTQAVFDADILSSFVDKVRSIKSIKIIAGIIPLKSEKHALFLNNLSLRVPEHIINDLKSSGNPEALGMKIAAGLIDELHNLCDGIHIMSMHHENTVKILSMAGIL